MNADRLNNIDQRLAQLVDGMEALREISHSQAATANLQAENVRSLVSAVGELARSTTELSRDRRTLMETAQRAAQASETASFVAQRTLEAVRDLIDELRSNRS